MKINRKTWLIPLYVILAVSGVAAVSAYESHLVNVTAHVENALSVPTQQITLGTGDVFPKASETNSFNVGLSSSFTDPGQTRVDTVSYRVCAQPKLFTWPNPSVDFSWLWMGGAAFVRIDGGAWHWIGPTRTIDPPVGAVCPTGATGTLDTVINPSDVITIGLDVPVFENLDFPASLRAFGVCGQIGNEAPASEPCVTLPIPPADPAGTDLALDLVIQVTGISLGP